MPGTGLGNRDSGMERHLLYPRQSDNSVGHSGIWGPCRLHTGTGLWAVSWLKGGCVDEEGGGTAAKALLRMAYAESLQCQCGWSLRWTGRSQTARLLMAWDQVFRKWGAWCHCDVRTDEKPTPASWLDHTVWLSWQSKQCATTIFIPSRSHCWR